MELNQVTNKGLHIVNEELQNEARFKQNILGLQGKIELFKPGVRIAYSPFFGIREIRLSDPGFLYPEYGLVIEVNIFTTNFKPVIHGVKIMLDTISVVMQTGTEPFETTIVAPQLLTVL